MVPKIESCDICRDYHYRSKFLYVSHLQQDHCPLIILKDSLQKNKSTSSNVDPGIAFLEMVANRTSGAQVRNTNSEMGAARKLKDEFQIPPELLINDGSYGKVQFAACYNHSGTQIVLDFNDQSHAYKEFDLKIHPTLLIPGMYEQLVSLPEKTTSIFTLSGFNDWVDNVKTPPGWPRYSTVFVKIRINSLSGSFAGHGETKPLISFEREEFNKVQELMADPAVFSLRYKAPNQSSHIGGKVCLISTLNIRYEGFICLHFEKLYGLAKVRSFGTENRPTANPVAARDDVYEYIIFKASHIKDLIKSKMAKTGSGVPYDPAIISVSSRSAPASGGAPNASAGSSRAGTPSRNSPLAHIANQQEPMQSKTAAAYVGPVGEPKDIPFADD